MSPHRRSHPAFAVPVIVVAFAAAASANLRAPARVDIGPSSALLAPTGEVTVTGETLDLRCRPTSCEVTASYTLTVAHALRIETAFILPDDVKRITLVQDPNRASARRAVLESVPIEIDDVPLALRSPRSAGDSGLARVPLVLDLTPGAHEVRVVYDSPTSVLEVGHSYFSEGVLHRSVVYEVWPLKAWVLGPEFQLTTSVAYEAPPPTSFLDRLFGQTSTVTCQGGSVETAEPGGRIRDLGEPWPTTVGRGGRLIEARREFATDELPDRLVCTMFTD